MKVKEGFNSVVVENNHYNKYYTIEDIPKEDQLTKAEITSGEKTLLCALINAGIIRIEKEKLPGSSLEEIAALELAIKAVIEESIKPVIINKKLANIDEFSQQANSLIKTVGNDLNKVYGKIEERHTQTINSYASIERLAQALISRFDPIEKRVQQVGSQIEVYAQEKLAQNRLFKLTDQLEQRIKMFEAFEGNPHIKIPEAEHYAKLVCELKYWQGVVKS